MKVLILAEGTRGDIQPFLALAQAIEAAGHRAAVIGLTRWPSAYIAESGVSFTLVGKGAAAEPYTSLFPRLTLGGIREVLARAEIARRLRPVLTATLEEVWAAASEGADVVAFTPGLLAGQQVAERLGVPAAAVAFDPRLVPAGETANRLPGRPVPKARNWLPYPRSLFAWPYRGPTRTWRERTLQLPPRRGDSDPWRRPDGGPAPVLGAYSRHVVPPSSAASQVCVTGFWLSGIPGQWQPPPDLARFVERGDPPVYVGFGSMHMTAPGQTWRTVLSAIEQARVRAVVAVGWSGGDVAAPGENVYVTDQVPHAWLFPRARAIVHHGGAGTTAAALAAGRPQVICPWFADQPFWGSKMRELGVAGNATALHRHTPASLAAAIGKAASDQGLRRLAETMGEAVRAENGAESAVKFLEQIHKERQS